MFKVSNLINYKHFKFNFKVFIDKGLIKIYFPPSYKKQIPKFLRLLKKLWKIRNNQIKLSVNRITIIYNYDLLCLFLEKKVNFFFKKKY